MARKAICGALMWIDEPLLPNSHSKAWLGGLKTPKLALGSRSSPSRGRLTCARRTLHRRRHEGGRNGGGNAACEDRVDVAFARLVDAPAANLINGIELTGPARAP